MRVSQKALYKQIHLEQFKLSRLACMGMYVHVAKYQNIGSIVSDLGLNTHTKYMSN